MDEFKRVLRESLPEIIGGLVVAAILAIIGVAYTVFRAWIASILIVVVLSFVLYVSLKRRSSGKTLSAEYVRQVVSTFLISERAEIHSAFSPGSITLLVGDIVGNDKLFLSLPWANYRGDVQTQDLVDYLIEVLSKGERCLLLGQPGQGKTTVLKRVFTIMADRFLNGSSEMIPLFVSLREVAFPDREGVSLSLFALVDYLCNRSWNPFPLLSEQFVSLVRQGRIALLLDGFDEMTGELSQRRINERAAGDLFHYPGILSCRTNFYELYLSASSIQACYLRKIELLPVPFSDPVKRYIREVCETKRNLSFDRVISAISVSQQLQELAQRPLLLSMILDVFTESDETLEIEWSMAKLYKAYTERWLKNEARKPDSVLRWDEKAELVEEIAWSTYRAKNPSTYAYGDSLYQAVVFSKDELSSFLKACAAQYQHIPFNRLIDDICLRTFLIGSYGGYYYFVHKSFQEYGVASRIFKSMQHGVERTAEALQEFIPVEVATFLTDMLMAKDLPEYRKRLIERNLMDAYQQYKGNDHKSLLIRQHAAHYLARLGTWRATDFLEKVLEGEPNKWVWRGIAVGLFRFCGKTERLDQYIGLLHEDPEAASINIGYHLVYYGDQPLEEGYYDRGKSKCDGTVRAIFRHLQEEQHRPAWALDLLTLRSLLETRGSTIFSAEHLSFLREFLDKGHQGQNETFHREKELLKDALRRRGLL